MSDTLGSTLHWLARWTEVVPPGDRLPLVSPPHLVAKFIHYAMADRSHLVPADDIDARDPKFVSLIVDLARAFGRHYFRLELDGVENLPAQGGALLVGNHNGGLVPLEPFFTLVAAWDRFGPARAVYSLAHDFLFDDPMLRRYAGKVGALRAGRDGARRALDAGNLVLVYPGGDLDAFRTFRNRSRIELGHRTGFAELALRSRVPIVPIVTAGAHEQFIVLTRGDRAAQLLHLHEWARVVVLPIVLAAPWGITIGFVPYLPLPAPISMTITEPMTWPGLSADNPADVRRVYDDVHTRMQSTLDRMSAGRHFLRRPHLDEGNLGGRKSDTTPMTASARKT